ncbi:MAG: VWA domain-containing protein [Azonexus sp.]|nr:VWA domain-containing protein [Azonexus sp.]
MEEWVGKLWHRWITKAAGGHYPDAAVALKTMERPLAIFFRALGGDAGLRVAAATADAYGDRRTWLARVAGSGERLSFARRDENTLRLPPQLDAFPDPALNRDLYYWLAAQAACLDRLPAEMTRPEIGYLRRNQAATLLALATWPGLASRYRRLVAAYLPERLPPGKMPPDEAERERAIRRALEDPGSVDVLPEVSAKAPPPQPVLLWLQWQDTADAANSRRQREDGGSEGSEQSEGGARDASQDAHRAEQVEAPKEKHGMLIFFRAESLLSVAEFLRVNRSVDDDPDPNAEDAARAMEQLALAENDDNERIASRIRFDLDLPSAAEDDIPLGEGIPLPEWDYRKQSMQIDHVRLQEMASRHAEPTPLPERLRRTARRLHQQFSAIQPGRRWLKAQPDGSELDLDAVVRATTDRKSGLHSSGQLHLSLEKRERDLACLVLADLSLSTDTWVSSEARVIDVIRDALLLFGETLRSTGDRFAICGFSSVRRSQVRFHRLKEFAEPFNDAVRGRVQAIRPGYYTRMGAAIRRASQLLAEEAASRRILLILSDGKPNDLDLYDSRYGIEDTRAAVHEARRLGLIPFCLTIDREGGGYLPHLFGPTGYAIVRSPEELPQRLPMFYAQLTH